MKRMLRFALGTAVAASAALAAVVAWPIGVPLSELKAGAPVSHDKTKKTYLHCRSGKRVMTARPLLEGMGFTDVTDLREGFDALAKAGFERAK